MIPTAAGPKRADELAELVPAGAWQRLSCADGSKGPRLYDWALVASHSSDHWLLVRRSRAWYRHITLAMLAHAFLAVTARATRPAAPQPPQSGPACGNAGSEPVKKGI
jgi:hypothetical protein